MSEKRVKAWGEDGRKWNPNVQRVKLAEAIPLSTPFVAYVDPCNLCNFRCKFCPTGHKDLLKKHNRPAGYMEFELFEKIISDFKKFPDKLRVLFMHKDGEPLINPRIGDMLKLAKSSDIAEKIWLTTNASLLTEEKALDILDSGIDAVRLSIEHVSAEGYKELVVTYDNYDKILKNVEFLFKEKTRRNSHLEIVAKMINFDFSQEQVQKFARDFGDITDEVLLTEPGSWTNDAGVDFNLGVTPKKGYDGLMPLDFNRMTCPYPFYNLAINFDGSVSCCGLDWAHSLTSGNVRDESLVDIWHGRQMNMIRLHHLEGKRDQYRSCNGCQCIRYMPEDNELHEHREKLIQIVKRDINKAQQPIPDQISAAEESAELV